ncbi:MAG: sulfatase-like hydrolase/transferase [Planctomycetota bacterium]
MPNLIFILTDDQRYDALGVVNPLARTPTMDALAKRGTVFRNAFVATSICSPSRACCLTGRYGSANGVPGLGMALDRDEVTFAQSLKEAGYQTGYVGKWHLRRPKPKQAGFEAVTYFESNGPHYNRRVIEHGKKKTAQGYIEDYLADQSVAFIEQAVEAGRPFVLHHATQIPHMDHRFSWPAQDETLALYPLEKMPVPETRQDDLRGKPPYLRNARSYVRAQQTYGYTDPANIRRHWQAYLASITEMDRSLGRLVAALGRLGIADETWIVLMGDNGWFMGEHGFTSKVLPYEESIRVPFLVSGPGLEGEQRDELVLNADISPTLVDLAGLPVPDGVHGRSLLPLLGGEKVAWRDSILYEAPEPELGSWPLAAVRTARWKYIQTYAIKDPSRLVFEELYDLGADPREMTNLAGQAAHAAVQAQLREELGRLRSSVKD